MRSTKGFILIMVLGLIVAMIFLAFGLSVSAVSSKKISTTAILKARARLLARSGIEKTNANFKSMVFVKEDLDFENNYTFGGEDLNRDGVVSSQEDSLGNNNQKSETQDLLLGEALCPSFALKDPNQDKALLIQVESKSRGISWQDQFGGFSRIKVNSQNDVIDLNGGFVEGNALTDRENFDSLFNENWTAVSIDHAYNRPTVNFLNALGNYYLYLNRIGAQDPTRNYLWDDPASVNDPVTIDNIANLDNFTNPAPFSPTQSYPTTADISVAGLGHHVIKNRPDQGFQNIDEAKLLVKEWAKEKGLSKEVFWENISALIGLPTNKRSSTYLYRQELLQPLNSARHSGLDKAELSRKLGNRGDDGTRAWLTVKGYQHPRVLVNINTAPRALLAALIYSVKDIQYRHVSYDDTYSLMRPLLMANHEFINHPSSMGGSPLLSGIPAGAVRIRENNIEHSSVYEAIRYAGPNMDLFSMTESIQMAKTIIKRREQKPFQSQQEFYDFLASYPYGFDAKAPGSQGKVNQAEEYSSTIYFHDLFTYNERERLLWTVLNPNGNMRHFVFEEALPLTTNCKEFRYAHPEKNFFAVNGNPSQGERYAYRGGSYGQIDFDKTYPHEFASEICFANDGLFHIESEGFVLSPQGKIQAQNTITTLVSYYDFGHLTHQKDFNASLINSATNQTTTYDWVTYPEIGVIAPSTLDGQLALRPITINAISGLNNLRAHYTLNSFHSLFGFDDLCTLNRTSLSSGWFQKTLTTTTPYGNPWNPKSDLGQTTFAHSLFSANTTPNALTSTNHLFPGGGYYPDAQATTPLDGVPGNPEIDTDRKLGSFVLPAPNLASSEEGAISFFFKPHRYPLSPYTVVHNDDEKYRRHDRTPFCLFDYHFLIKDSEVEMLVRDDLQDPNYTDPPYGFLIFQGAGASKPGLYRCNIRLLYGGMWSAYPEEYPVLSTDPKKSKPFGIFPLDGPLRTRLPLASNFEIMEGFPLQTYNHDISGGSIVFQKPLYLSPFNPVIPFFFHHMNGMPFPHNDFDNYQMDSWLGGGYLNHGELSEQRYDTATNYQKHVSDKLWLELRVSPVMASMNAVDSFLGNNESYKTGIPLGPIENSALATPEGLGIYENEFITYNSKPAPNPGPNDLNKNFFIGTIDSDQYSGRSTGSHTVVKSFRLDYPLDLYPNSPNFCLGPQDNSGDPQGMVNQGRWHHFVIAWRNIHDLLAFDQQNHKGGSIALYHNGTFKKDVAIGNHIWPYRGMFWNTDFYPGYYQNTSYYLFGFNESSVTHMYGDLNFDFYPMDLLVPFPHYDLPPNQGTRWKFFPRNFADGRSRGIKGFGMEANNDYYPRPEVNILGVTNPLAAQNYWFGSTGNYSGLQYFDVGGERVNEVSSLLRHASNRMFFGAAPHGVENWPGNYELNGNPFPLSHKYLADGNFMDIRIFDSASGLYATFDAAADGGGFVPNLPNYGVSPYPIESDQGRLFPFGSKQKDGKLLALHWTAYLPPFHQFWDDVSDPADPINTTTSYIWNSATQTYTLVTGQPGPDLDDQFWLSLNIETDVGGVWQEPTPENDLYLEQGRPLQENQSFYLYDNPVEILANDQTSLRLRFQKGQTAAGLNFSTPLIDDLTFYYLPAQSPRILSWQQN